MFRGDEQSVKDLSEDLIKLGLLDLSVSGLVDSLDELLDLLLVDLTVLSELLESSLDEVEHLLLVKALTVVFVELAEHGIDGFSKLLVCVSHFFFSN